MSLIRPWDTSLIHLYTSFSRVFQFQPHLKFDSLSCPYLVSLCLALTGHRIFVSGPESLEYALRCFTQLYTNHIGCYMQLWYWSLTFCCFVLPSITMNQLLKAQCGFNASCCNLNFWWKDETLTESTSHTLKQLSTEWNLWNSNQNLSKLFLFQDSASDSFQVSHPMHLDAVGGIAVVAAFVVVPIQTSIFSQIFNDLGTIWEPMQTEQTEQTSDHLSPKP